MMSGWREGGRKGCRREGSPEHGDCKLYTCTRVLDKVPLPWKIHVQLSAFSGVVSRGSRRHAKTRRDRPSPSMRNRATVRERSGKAAPKPRGSNAKKRARSPAETLARAQLRDPVDAQDAAAADKKSSRGSPCSARRSCSSASYALQHLSPAQRTPLLSTAGAAAALLAAGVVTEGAVRLVWRRCGLDGRDGTTFTGAEHDSRCHRYNREYGFAACPTRPEIDQDA
eukprot:2692696-Prymnesium_polylepis.1